MEEVVGEEVEEVVEEFMSKTNPFNRLFAMAHYDIHEVETATLSAG